MENQNHHHHRLNFHLHHHHHQEKEEELKDVPKGCVAIMVGQGEEQKRFVIPVIYVNHPLFEQLLKEAEEEYGFDRKGPITIPCHVEEFQAVQGMIHKEKSHHHHHLLLHGSCFRQGLIRDYDERIRLNCCRDL
ncbi:Auxin-induced protein 10A5 [Tripterygium wilfordii]|uniref:Auxin-induced protein 10A5 n=1 Tax=Tripterygium wilfordii TaxID=458696 RepID=A0A7J7DAQ4_TRIWF|nr:auxin-responsive protein SAUR32-like [Tripterygium wilfordii]KAF5743442.1 Auxin-induced protein 10A5 [Tripterygium wilfordii]